MRGFTPRRSGTPTIDRRAHNEKHAGTHRRRPARPFSNQLSQSAPIQLEKMELHSRGGLFLRGELASVFIFLGRAGACAKRLTQDHLEDTDRSSADGCVSSRSSALISENPLVGGVTAGVWRSTERVYHHCGSADTLSSPIQS